MGYGTSEEEWRALLTGEHKEAGLDVYFERQPIAAAAPR
jgi:hypothetical protein